MLTTSRMPLSQSHAQVAAYRTSLNKPKRKCHWMTTNRLGRSCQKDDATARSKVWVYREEHIDIFPGTLLGVNRLILVHPPSRSAVGDKPPTSRTVASYYSAGALVRRSNVCSTNKIPPCLEANLVVFTCAACFPTDVPCSSVVNRGVVEHITEAAHEGGDLTLQRHCPRSYPTQTQYNALVSAAGRMVCPPSRQAISENDCTPNDYNSRAILCAIEIEILEAVPSAFQHHKKTTVLFDIGVLSVVPRKFAEGNTNEPLYRARLIFFIHRKRSRRWLSW